MRKSIVIKIKRIPYRLVLIGRGGTAYIYQGTPSKAYLPKVTLKILKKRYLASRKICSRFANERRITQALSSPGLPRFIVSGKICQRPYYAYHYIDGYTLLDFIKYVPPGHYQLTATIVRKILVTLSALHDRTPAIIHGDISPENIILSTKGPVIIDFGSAQWLNNAGHIPDSRWIGKLGYLSPEQAQGVYWDERSDLYQIGMIFYELLTRRRYNPGTDITTKRLFAAAPQKPNYIGIPQPYHAVLDALLDPLPLKRIANAKEAIAMLDIAAQLNKS